MSIYSLHSDTNIQQDVDVLEEIEATLSHQLVVYNDEVNTFDWVIESLMKICRHTHEQATQCSLFIHFKGKYAVQHGDELTLIPMKDALLDRGISAAIESCNS
ncbi:MAG TPA: ATP-dependent Clp protease adaptor ClpS [Chitinophagales bacterium]|jgi:ATP-dependent Clp protease adaptor protein ClpS|nr:ATP-dependent Clp protease adaptor ClpS [Chitinophagales bacterium]MBP6153734.1 ATP-dependent Clp protease adaptor ClpS [Chitinophagales bacterium]HQV78167.1 ATP-dependent Clp protease adaptor ClpS [Chitinophagales bacterium]HQW79364.1 ATP-dependent Clp protease adaptor ClpS [Chitinophagales bacterium]HRB19130.1 ATP-dependent Clp protease adaptor ClpS [Chitinophagales bacterium]